MHICFEGIDGTGKTTLSKAVKERLESEGKSVFHTSEPGNPNQKCSMSIRDLVLNKEYEKEIDDFEREHFLALNRRIQYKKSKEELAKGKIVIQDRGWLSGFSYSQAKGFSHSFIDDLNERLTPSYKNMFDVIIYLNNNEDISETLRKAQDAKQEFSEGDTIESKGVNFQESVRDNYVDLVSKYEKSVYIIKIDIYENNKRLTVDELIVKVMKHLSKKIFMFVGNSGSGKSTLELELVNQYPHLFSRVVSYTTRPIDKVNRKEIDGLHYNFISLKEFEKMKSAGMFIQYTEYGGNYYASAYESYENKTPNTVVVIAPEKGKKLADELEQKGYEVKWVVFDISDSLIKSNLIKDGEDIKVIEKRFSRENNKLKFKEMKLKASYSIKDQMLNKQLPEAFVEFLRE
jgi:dTMP kinase